MQKKDASYLNFGSFRIHKAWVMLAGSCVLQSATLAIVLGCCGLFFVPVCEELGFARAEIAAFQTAYFLSMIPAMPLAGRIIAKYNIRVVTTISTIAVACAAALMGTYSYSWQWLVSGVIFGTFGCLVFHLPLVVMVGNWFYKRTGLAMGLGAAMSAVAIVILSPLIQNIISTLGWRTAYFFEAGLMLILALPWTLFVFRRKPSDIDAFPYSGGNQGKGDDSEKDAENVKELERGVPAKAALKSIPFAMVFIFAGFAAIIGSGFDSHIPGFANSIGFDATFGAMMLSALAFGSFCEKMVMGIINDRFGVWVGVVCEIIIITSSIIALIILRNPILVLVATVFFGTQDSLTSVSLPLLVKKLFGTKDYAQIYSWARVGAGVFGSFASVMVGMSWDVYGSYVPAFLVAICICVLIAAIIFVAHRTKNRLQWVE